MFTYCKLQTFRIRQYYKSDITRGKTGSENFILIDIHFNYPSFIPSSEDRLAKS